MLECPHYSARELADLRLPELPSTERGVQLRVKREGWSSRKRKGRGGGREYSLTGLPKETQAAVLLKEAATHISRPVCQDGKHCPPDAALIVPPMDRREVEREALWQDYERATDKRKQKAAKKNAALVAVERLIHEGEKLTRATQIIAGECHVDPGTLYRWMQRVKGIDRCDWTAALVDRHNGGGSSAEVSIEAWDYFKADYLRLEKPAASACYDRLMRIAGPRAWSVPSCQALLDKLKREISGPVILLARDGQQALKRSYPAQQRDRSVFHALEAVNADGHRFDLFIRWPDQTICRVVMVAWQDLYSGKILSWRVDATENSDSIRLSYGDMVDRYGIPSFAYLDNGRGFAAKWLTGGVRNRYRFKIKAEDPTGILVALGTGVHWTSPYWGQTKPLERGLLDLCESVAKHPAFSGAYTGNKPTAKPENYASRAIPLDQFLKILDTEIIAHNARQGRRSTVCSGRSFDQAFEESYSKSIIRKATEEQKRLWLLGAEGIMTSRQDGSILLLSNRYWIEALAQYKGEKLVVRFDPQRLHQGIFVYQLDGRYIGAAACVAAVGFNDTEAAREHARLRNQNIKTAKQTLANERRMSALEVAQMLPAIEDPDPPETKLVRPIFNVRTALNAFERDDEDNAEAETRFQRALKTMEARLEAGRGY